jgi:uncharacterized repeat protein (TIGR03803 family)
MTPDGTVTLVHKFHNDGDGECPNSLVIGPDGTTLFGTTRFTTDAYYGGTAFAIAEPGGKLRVQHTFVCETGCNPSGLLVTGPDKALYGTTSNGGTLGAGTVYRLAPHGEFSVLHNFFDGDPIGVNPAGGLTRDEHGRLYGTTQLGGRYGAGVVFSITRDGVGHVLHAFDIGQPGDGFWPVAAPLLLPGGLLYGTTLSGGNGGGTVWLVRSGR